MSSRAELPSGVVNSSAVSVKVRRKVLEEDSSAAGLSDDPPVDAAAAAMALGATGGLNSPTNSGAGAFK